eukprot:8798309-Heterocapsa_arctica.AAC.1
MDKDSTATPERRHDDERGRHGRWNYGDENIYDVSCALNEHREGFWNNEFQLSRTAVAIRNK